MDLIDVERLNASDRDRIGNALRERAILAEPKSGGASRVWWIVAFTAAALLTASIAEGLGRVTSAYDGLYWPAVIALLDGALAALVVRSLFGVRAASAARPLPWPPGRFLYPWGLIDTTGPWLRFAAPTQISSIDVHKEEPGPSGLSLITISVHVGEAVEKFLLFGFEKNIPRARLDALIQPVAADKVADATGYRDAPTNRALLTPEAIASAKVAGAPSKPSFLTANSGRLSLAAGLVLALVLWVGVLPMMSLRAIESRSSAPAWTALASAFPFPWITSRARAAVDDRWRAADRGVDAHIAAGYREPFHRLVAWARDHRNAGLRVLVSGPPYSEMQAATQWLNANAGGSAHPSEVIVGYASVDTAGAVPGDDSWRVAIERLVHAAIDADLVPVELARGDASESRARVIVVPHMRAERVLSGAGSAVFAALAFDFDVDMAIPGGPTVPLAHGVRVDAPMSLTVSRLAMQGETLPPLGASGSSAIDFSESTMAYAQQLGGAAQTASETVRARLSQ